MFFRLICFVAVFVLVTECVAAAGDITEYNVDTRLSKDTTWSGTVRLSKKVLVPEGVTLKIVPGTVIEITGEFWKTKIEVRGKLEAAGTKEKPIRIHGGKRKLCWRGISFIGEKAGGTIKHCIVESQSHMVILCNGSSPAILHNRFLNGGSIVCRNGSKARIEDNTFITAAKRERDFAAILVVSSSPTILGNKFGKYRIGIQVSAFDRVEIIHPNGLKTREVCPVGPEEKPTVKNNTISADGILVFDERQKAPQRWKVVFTKKDIYTGNLRRIEVKQEGKSHKVYVYAHPSRQGAPHGKMKRYCLMHAGGEYQVQQDVVPTSPPVGPQWGAWYSMSSVIIDGDPCRLIPTRTVLGKLREEGCADTQPAHLLVVRQKGKKNRLIWVSQKYDRGHLRAAVADLNNDGHEEIVISTGRWCARKGDIIVLEQVRQEKKKK